MRTLSIDIETYSDVDLIKCGVYKYTDSPNFEILLFAYAFDDEQIKCIDLAQGEKLPFEVLHALGEEDSIKTAFNANFERTCIAKFFNLKLDPLQWRCTAVHALTMGLPGGLDGVAKSMNLDVQKDAAGKALIKYFSVPCKPTKVNGGRTRNLPEHAPEKWEKYKSYCITDVEVERGIKKKLQKFEISEFELKLWALDQRINDRGVRLEQTLYKNAIECDAEYTKKLMNEAAKLTGLANPNSLAQLKGWLAENGLEAESLTKDTVPILISQAQTETVKRVLRIRQELGKTSVSKYQAMERGICSDNRVRGLLQFYGANRTGRWAGRLVQVQNLPRIELYDLDVARELLLAGDYEMLEVLFGKVPFVLSQLIRTAFIPEEGHRFIVSDFSAIEARVIAWLAGEQWRLDVFNGHGKIYEASASQMFHIPLESITKGSPYRQMGKVAELALGYQGGGGALATMDKKGEIDPEDYGDIIKRWRNASPNIVKFWYDVEKAAIRAVKEKKPVEMQHGLKFFFVSGVLFIQLPSGRRLAYPRPQLKPHDTFDKLALSYEGSKDQGGWGRIPTYGGKLVENIVQATARDCLAESLIRLDEAGYNIVFHVHDEAVIEAPIGKGSLADVEEIMGQPISWAKGLPLNADGFETFYYKKD